MLALAVASFVVAGLAALFKLTGSHTDVLQWLIIISLLLGSAAAICLAWGRPWWPARRG
jgi:hypothetical protein